MSKVFEIQVEWTGTFFTKVFVDGDHSDDDALDEAEQRVMGMHFDYAESLHDGDIYIKDMGIISIEKGIKE